MKEMIDCYQAKLQSRNLYIVYKNGGVVSRMIAESEERAVKLYKREEARKNRISDLVMNHIAMEKAMFGL